MPNLILPSEIPWPTIKGRDLEELLYWLFTSMGAKKIEWRIGGKGGGASDQGRDLELTICIPAESGGFTKQNWWVEAKGRGGTVEPNAVKSAVLNAAVNDQLDVLVIATNTCFSNPTRDWVKDWQRSHPKPEVRLWERCELEKLCSENPLAIVRLIQDALSPQGKVEVVSCRLWDFATFSDTPLLEDIWSNRDHVIIDGRSLVSLVASEMAHGDIRRRSWGTIVPNEILHDALHVGLLNLYHLIFRGDGRSMREEPLTQALGYLISMGTHRLGVSPITTLVENVWKSSSDPKFSISIKDNVLEVVLSRLRRELLDVCSSDCDRFSHREPTVLSNPEISNYWHRMLDAIPPECDASPQLVIESLDVPCKVGFDVSKNKSCPLCDRTNIQNEAHRFLFIVQEVTKFRTRQIRTVEQGKS